MLTKKPKERNEKNNFVYAELSILGRLLRAAKGANKEDEMVVIRFIS